MRIDRLDLIAYGPFTGKTLDLSDGDSGLHLIYGDNEAGKSTSLRALIAWLFGIPTRTPDSFFHSNPQLRIGGKLSLNAGESLDFVRRKGSKGTLLAPDSEEKFEDSVLLPFLPGGIDENLFKNLYGIDHKRLIEGGKDLLNQSGDVGQALFSAALGTVSLQEVLNELEKSADVLFKPRAKARIVNSAIAKYKEAKRRIRDSSLKVTDWKKLQADLREIGISIQKTDELISGKKSIISRLERTKRVTGPLTERASIRDKIEELGDLISLPEDFTEKARGALEKLLAMQEEKEKLEDKLARLKKNASSLNVSDELLENEERIQRIHRDLGAAEKAMNDLPAQESSRQGLLSEADALLKRIRPDVDLTDANSLRPLLNRRKRITELVRKHDQLTEKNSSIEEDIDCAEDEREQNKKEFEGLSSMKLNLGEIKAAISSARRSGNIEERLMGARKKSDEQVIFCKGELSRLGRYKGASEDLCNVPLPLKETLDRYEEEFLKTSDLVKELKQQDNRAESDKKQADTDLRMLLSFGDVPVLSELEETREIRNNAWSLIKSKFVEELNVEKEIVEFSPDSDLVTVYEGKVDSADAISDQLRLASDSVVKRTVFEGTIENLKCLRVQLTGKIEEAILRKEQLLGEWAGEWKPVGIEPGTPREMQQWILLAERFRTSMGTARALSGEVDNLLEELRKAKQIVAREIIRFDQTADLDNSELDWMIGLCEQYVEKEEGVLEQKRALENSIADSGIRLNRLRENIKRTERNLLKWSEEWGKAIEGLALKANINPSIAEETLEQLALFFNKFDSSRDLGKRVNRIKQVKKDFDQKVFEFAKSIGRPINDQSTDSIVMELHRDMVDSREARASLKEIQIQIGEVEGEVSEAEVILGYTKELLAQMREQAKADKNENLISLSERSEGKRKLMQRLDSLEQELMRNGDGRSFEDLEKEITESDADTLEYEMDKISIELDDLQTSRDEVRDTLKELKIEIDSKDGSSLAAEASEEAEQHLAVIVDGSERYLRLKIASLILRQKIEEYRKENQTPVLARAGELFSRLTLGSYKLLRDELDSNNNPILFGVRTNDVEVPVEGMSDGARDQLYLALRLATLEHSLTKGEPMPFIVDDILIGFDDDRTKVCLEILSELAVKTQVLLFTHHSRVIELAKGLKSEAGIFTYELA